MLPEADQHELAPGLGPDAPAAAGAHVAALRRGPDQHLVTRAFVLHPLSRRVEVIGVVPPRIAFTSHSCDQGMAASPKGYAGRTHHPPAWASISSRMRPPAVSRSTSSRKAPTWSGSLKSTAKWREAILVEPALRSRPALHVLEHECLGDGSPSVARTSSCR